MKTVKLIGMVPLVLFAAATSFGQGDDRAVPRTGGSSSGSDAGSRHSGGGSSSASSSSSSSSSSQNGGSSYSSDNQSSHSAGAAARRPRPGTGTGSRDQYGNDRDRYSSYPNSYYYYNPYSWGYPRSRGYGLYGYGYGYYDYGYSYGDYYGYYPSANYRSYRYRSGNIAQIRTLVEPAKTRVYVDGYYAGIVDEFDGLLQRLSVSPGRHEITLKLEGYKSHTFAVYVNREQTLKLRWDMAKGSGETRDTASDYDRPPVNGDDDRDFDRDRDDDDADDRDNDRETARSPRETARTQVDRSREVDSDRDRPSAPPSRDGVRGEVLLEIEPADASVYIDGEFHGKASQLHRVELSPGRHRIEVVRPGYKTEEAEIEVEGEAKKVVVKLGRR